MSDSARDFYFGPDEDDARQLMLERTRESYRNPSGAELAKAIDDVCEDLIRSNSTVSYWLEYEQCQK